MKHYDTLASLQPLVGQDIGTSDWVAITQARIDQFAQATGDHQWIHTDPVRAAAGPFGTTVAHGFLTLSLVPQLFDSGFAIADVKMGVNYGLNRVRFMAPVPVGSRLRARAKLLSIEGIDSPKNRPDLKGAQVIMQVTVEREGSDRPVCVAETISRRFS